MLSKEKKIKEFEPLSKNQKYNLRKLYKNFTDLDAKKIKSIEKKGLIDKNDILTYNNQAKSDESEILVLDQMIE